MRYNEYKTPKAGWKGYITNERTGRVVGWIATDNRYVPDHEITYERV